MDRRRGVGHDHRATTPTLNKLRTLESAIADMVASIDRLAEEVRRSELEGRRSREEMREFKGEMREFKDEMREFKDESRARMASFEQQAERDREEARQERRDLNRRLGEIANKQGRMIEDLVAPSVPRILGELLGVSESGIDGAGGERVRLRHPTDRAGQREIDVLASHGGTALVVEVKSVLKPERVTAYAASLPELLEYLRPLGIREVIGAVATLHAHDSIVRRATKLGLVVLAVGDELMERRNPDGFIPRRVS